MLMSKFILANDVKMNAAVVPEGPRELFPPIAGGLLQANVVKLKEHAWMDEDDNDNNYALPDEPVLSPLQRATTELNLYFTYRPRQEVKAKIMTADGLMTFWLGIGKRLVPYLSEVALCVLGCPPGSGTLENDFSSFANLLTRHRSSMLTSTAEMILFCKQNSSLIPDLIPIISNDDIRSHIPERITDPVKQNAIREMNVNANALYVDNESDSD